MTVHDLLIEICAWIVHILGALALMLGTFALLLLLVQKALAAVCRQLWATEMCARVVYELWRHKATWIAPPKNLVFFPPDVPRARRSDDLSE